MVGCRAPSWYWPSMILTTDSGRMNQSKVARHFVFRPERKSLDGICSIARCQFSRQYGSESRDRRLVLRLSVSRSTFGRPFSSFQASAIFWYFSVFFGSGFFDGREVTSVSSIFLFFSGVGDFLLFLCVFCFWLFLWT